jgi:hypothetical protein
MVHLLCCTIGDQRSGTKPGQVHYTQWLLLVGGLIFAVALNLNAVVIARHLSVDQTVRASIMRIAEQISVEGVDSTESEVRRLDDAVRTTGLPIGWG